MESYTARQNGYFDEIYSVFEAFRHPVIMVEDSAMRWMGIRVPATENLDLLVRDSQADAILNGLLALGYFERIEQDTRTRFNDPYTKQVPRLQDKRHGPEIHSCINLWTEKVYMLRVEDADPIPVMDIHAWNVALVDELFAATPATAWITLSACAEKSVRILPDKLSTARNVPVFVPSIAKICNA